MRIRFNTLFDNIGDISLRRRARWLIEKLAPKNGDVILDVGCGDGFYLFLLSSLNPNVKLYGVDNDYKALKSAKNNLKGDTRIKLIHGDIQNLPFDDRIFDAVLASEVLEHLEDDEAALKEIFRVLKKGGKLVLSVPSKNYPFFWDPPNWILERLFGTHIENGFWSGIWSQHKRLYSVKQIKNKLKPYGFKNIEQDLLTHYCLPFNHHLINIVAKFLVSNKVPPHAKSRLSKFNKPNGGNFNIFWPIFLLDKLNDFWSGKDSAVSLVASARKL